MVKVHPMNKLDTKILMCIIIKQSTLAAMRDSFRMIENQKENRFNKLPEIHILPSRKKKIKQRAHSAQSLPGIHIGA